MYPDAEQMNIFLSYLKIVSGLVISYSIVLLFSNLFFIGDSPSLRPHLDQYLASKINTKVSSLIAALNFGGGQKASEQISPSEFTQFMSTTAAHSLEKVSPGTYAATVKGKKVIIIKSEEIATNKSTYLIGGKQVIFKTDGGPLSQAEIEKTLQEFDEFERSQK